MSESIVVAELELITQAIGLAQDVTARLIERTRDAERRLEELGGDVAGLGVRVAELERHARIETLRPHPAFSRYGTLEELAATLRQELADEVEAITQRITDVHTPALRALTELTERNTTA